MYWKRGGGGGGGWGIGFGFGGGAGLASAFKPRLRLRQGLPVMLEMVPVVGGSLGVNMTPR